MEIVGISGRVGVGKDLIGSIFSLINSYYNNPIYDVIPNAGSCTNYVYANLMSSVPSEWEIVKFAKPLKQILSILLSVNEDKFEDREFKSRTLPSSWWVRKGDDKVITEKEYRELPETLKPLFGEAIKPTVRDLLRTVGTDLFRNQLNPDVWVNALFNSLEPKKDGKFIITDVRFRNEAEEIKRTGGVIINVNRKVEKSSHVSENDLKDWKFDYVINNDSDIFSLIDKVHLIYNEIVK